MIVPAGLVERYEALADAEDGRVARDRLVELNAGRTTAIPTDEMARILGL